MVFTYDLMFLSTIKSAQSAVIYIWFYWVLFHFVGIKAIKSASILFCRIFLEFF